MIYWMTDVCGRFVGNRHDKLRAGMLHHFVRADIVCRRAGRQFTDEDWCCASKHFESAMKCYNALAAEAVTQNIKNWKLVPKFHALVHIANDYNNTYPRRTQCYLDEDMVGKMKRIFVKCHANTAHYRSLQRYCILVGLRFWLALHVLRGIPTET